MKFWKQFRSSSTTGIIVIMSYPCVVAPFPFFPANKDIVVLTADPDTKTSQPGHPLFILPHVSPDEFVLNRDRVIPVETDYMYNNYLPASNVHGAPAHVTSSSFPFAPFGIDAVPHQVLVNPLFEDPVAPVIETIVAALPHTNDINSK
jgi:hypothetical protein